MIKVEDVFFRMAAFGLIFAGILLRVRYAPPVRVGELLFGIGLCILSLVSLPADKRGGKHERVA
jgi:hypothetical protein